MSFLVGFFGFFGLNLLYLIFVLTGVNVKSRWEDIFKVCHPHIDDHTFAFNEPHLLLGCLGAGQTAVTQQMMDSIENFIRLGKMFVWQQRWKGDGTYFHVYNSFLSAWFM